MIDEELMILYKEGDQQAFEALYQRHKGRVMGYLTKRLRDPDEAEDVFQQVFIKLHKNRQLYRDSTPFLAWLFTLAKNVMIDHLRKEAKSKQVIFYSDEIIQNTAIHEKQPLDLLERISALSSLSQREKESLKLRFEQGLDFDEIAKEFTTTSANARKIISRTLSKVKTILKPDRKQNE